jgi:hypothetical protein
MTSTELLEDLQHVQEELAKVPDLAAAAQSGKGGWILSDLFEDLSELIGIDSSLKIKLAVPVFLGLFVIFGSIAVGSLLPQNLKTADPKAVAERDADREWQNLDALAQREFERHNLSSAEGHYVKALEIAEKYGDDRRRLYGTLQKLQNVYMAERRYDKSDEIETRLKTILSQDSSAQ